MSKAKCIMVQGTMSGAGKSLLCAALCRIFAQDGYRVAPFKSQNMALNSFVTRDGLEMGRAQVVQAQAAGIEPDVRMNPILLKPSSDVGSQVIVHGEVRGQMKAADYFRHKKELIPDILSAYHSLAQEVDVIVIEGAGSPAEINLKEDDIVNMRVAKYLQAPVLLIADIDRGGSLAALVGTLELLDEEERALVKGLVINKFRGDVTLMTPAVDFLEQKTGKPVLGIVPYLEHLGIDDEDSVSLEEKEHEAERQKQTKELRLAVVETPKISNFTDFDALADEPDAEVLYVRDAEELLAAAPDVILLPGSKNTTEDLLHVHESGLAQAIRQLVDGGTPLIGICGGYQMLGEEIADPHHTESSHDVIKGLGYLPMKTVFAEEKRTVQVTADCPGMEFYDGVLMGKGLSGYEIHMGRTEFTAPVRHPFHLTRQGENAVNIWDGALSEDGRIFGTYLHGVFDHDGFRRQFLNVLRLHRGLRPLPVQRNRHLEKERAYDRLAETVRKSLDMEKLAAIMEGRA